MSLPNNNITLLNHLFHVNLQYTPAHLLFFLSFLPGLLPFFFFGRNDVEAHSYAPDFKITCLEMLLRTSHTDQMFITWGIWAFLVSAMVPDINWMALHLAGRAFVS